MSAAVANSNDQELFKSCTYDNEQEDFNIYQQQFQQTQLNQNTHNMHENINVQQVERFLEAEEQKNKKIQKQKIEFEQQQQQLIQEQVEQQQQNDIQIKENNQNLQEVFQQQQLAENNENEEDKNLKIENQSQNEQIDNQKPEQNNNHDKNDEINNEAQQENNKQLENISEQKIEQQNKFEQIPENIQKEDVFDSTNQDEILQSEYIEQINETEEQFQKQSKSEYNSSNIQESIKQPNSQLLQNQNEQQQEQQQNVQQLTIQQRIQQALDLKEKGNKRVQAQDYEAALKYYSEALEIIHPAFFRNCDKDIFQQFLQLNNILLSNAAFSHYNIGRYQNAIVLSQEVIRTDQNHEKSLFRLALCYKKLGDIEKSYEYIKKCYVISQNAQIKKELISIKEEYQQYKKKNDEQQQKIFQKMFESKPPLQQSVKKQNTQETNKEKKNQSNNENKNNESKNNELPNLVKYAAYTIPSTIVAALVSNIVLKGKFWTDRKGLLGFSFLSFSFYGFLMNQGFLGKLLFGISSLGIIGGMIHKRQN